MSGSVQAGTMVVNLRADVSPLKADMATATGVVQTSSKQMGSDLTGIRSSMDGINASLKAMADAEQARSDEFTTGLGQTKNLFNIASAAAKEAQQSFAALKLDPNAIIVPDKAIQSLKDWKEVAAYSLGIGLAVGIETAKTAFDHIADFVKTKLIIAGAVAATGIAAAVFTGIYAAYKAIDFGIGLLTGESYKSLNIDALVKMNEEVKSLQESLQLTAVGASALNEALKKQGLDATEYAATMNGVRQAVNSNSEEMDRLGVKYKDQKGGLLSTEGSLKSALAVLGTYTAGWDRHQAEVAIGMGTEKQIQAALSITAEKTQEAKDRLIDYGLVIGAGTQEAVARYQESMRQFEREADLTSQGFKRAIADNIMPILTDLSDFFRDGFPLAVRAFRYSMATVTSLFYGLKTVVYMVSESIVGSISAIGSGLGGLASAAMKALGGDFTGAKEALVKGWEDAKTRLGGIGDNIIEQARHNSDAMALAWGADSLGANNVENSVRKVGKAWKAAAKDADEAAAAIQSDFDKLMKSENEKLATAIAELLATEKLNDAEKVRIKLIADLRDGAVDMTEAEQKIIKSRIDIRDAVLKETEAEKYYLEQATKRYEATSALVNSAVDEASKNEELARTFGLTKTVIEELELARLQELLVQKGGIDACTEETAKLDALIDAKKRNIAALQSIDTQTIAKKAAEDASAAWQKSADDIDKSLSNAIMHGFTGTKGFITDFISGLKGLFSKLVLQPIIAPISGGIASILNPTAAQAAGSFGSTLNLGGSGGILDSVSGFLGLGGGMSAGAGGVGITSAATGSLASLGLGGTETAAMGTAFLGESAATSLATAGSVAGTGFLSTVSSGLAAIGPVGWAALAAGAIYTIFGGDDGPEQNTKLSFSSSKNAVSGSTATGRNQVGGNYVGGAGVNTAFGSYGVSDQFWIDAIASANRPKLDAFLQGVKASDAALAKYLTTDEQNRVKGALDASTTVLSTGAEGSDPSSQYGVAFTARIKAILDGVESGMSNFIDGFAGTGDQLSAEAAAILSARKNIDSIGKTVGESVTIGELAALKNEGESVGAAIARLTNEFKLTDAIALSLGQDAKSAFGALGLASTAARDRLVSLAGGLDKLQSGAAFFAQNFLTQAEQLAPVQKQVTEGLAELGLSSVTTRDQFKAAVQALDLSSEAGQTQYVALMGLQQAFVQVTPVIDAVTAATTAQTVAADLSNKTSQLNIQIMQLSSDAAGALAAQRQIELSALDASLQPLQARIYALQDEAAASVIAAQHRDLDIQLMEAVGNAEGALAARRQDALGKLDAYSQGVQQQIWAAQDASAASQKAQQSASAEAQRVQQEQQQADQQVKQAYDQRVSAARSKLQEAYNREASALQGVISKMDSFADAARKLQNSLIYGDSSTLDTSQKYASAKAGLPDVIARANAGDSDALGQLQQFVEISKASSANFIDYQRDFGGVIATLDHSAATAETASSIAKRQLEALKAQTDQLLNVDKDVLTVADAIYALQDAMMGGLAGVADAVIGKASADAAATLRSSATSKYGFAGGASYGKDAVSSAYTPPSSGEDYARYAALATSIQDYVASNYINADKFGNNFLQPFTNLVMQNLDEGRMAAANGKPYAADWNSRVLGGVADGIDQLLQAQFGGNPDPDYVKKRNAVATVDFSGVPGFASGGSFGGGLRLVGENGPELEVTGPSQIFSASQTRDMLSGGNTGRLEALVERLIERVEAGNAKASAQESFMRQLSTTGSTLNVTVVP